MDQIIELPRSKKAGIKHEAPGHPWCSHIVPKLKKWTPEEPLWVLFFTIMFYN